MRSRFAWLFVCFFVIAPVLGGCAFQKAIDAGHALVEARRYRAALAEYERALRLDEDSGEARALIAQILPYALDEADADMHAELAKGDYEAAMGHVAYVRRYDGKRADELATTVSALMRTNVEALMAKGDMLGAYPLAVRTAKLFPEMQGLGAIFERLRGHFLAQSDQRALAGQYREALASLDVIENHEPAMHEMLAPRRAKIRGVWADTVVVKAVAAEGREELGVAAVHYARAFEIAGRDADGDAMRRLIRVLRADGAFNLVITYAGDPRRRAAVAKLASPRLTSIEGLTMAPSEDASMIANVHAGAASCTETYTTSTRSKDYVAGTRQVPNPAYATLSAEIDNETTAIQVSTGKVSSKSAEVDRLEARLKQCERRRDNARAHGDGHRQPPSCTDISSKLSTAKSELGTLSSDLSAAESRLQSATSQRARTPQSFTEEIIETFTYEVRHHTRRCDLSLTAALEPAWSGAESHQVTGDGSASDDSHAGYGRYGIPQDDLSYSLSDGDLIAHADHQAAGRLANLVKSKVGGYYRAMTDRALALESDDPIAGVDMLVAIVAAGRTHLDEGRVGGIGQRLRARLDLENIETLRK